MRVGFFQTRPIRTKVEENVGKALRRLSSVRDATIVLPELCTSGYLFSDREELAGCAESVPEGPSTRAFLDLAGRNRLTLVFGIPESKGRRIYNSSVLVTPAGGTRVYRKVHLFDREKSVFDAGGATWRCVRTPEANLGMMICFDWRYPEACRALALAGAEVVCHPSNLVHPYCQEAMRTRCLENRVFAITANRIGSERVGETRIRFTGESRIIDPGGEVLARGSKTGESLKIVEIDPRSARDKTVTPANDLFRDRRPHLYRRLTDE